MRKLFSLSLAVVGLIALAAPAMAQDVEFEPLGVTCGPAFFPTFCAVDMSGDGNTILFRDRIWRAGSGFEMIGGPPGGFDVVALSDDGSTVVGNVFVLDSPIGPHVEAAIWLGGDAWQPLGGLPSTKPCGTSFSSAYDVLGDGSKVVGLVWVGDVCRGAHAFEWTEDSGMVDLGSIVADRSSRANAISADGSMVVGWSDSSFGNRLGAYWKDGSDPVWFEPDGSPIAAGEATGVSSDGRFVVGGAYNDNSDPLNPASKIFEPWLWSEETGVVPLGTVKGLRGALVDGQHYARDVSDDGRVVVGQDTLFQLGEQWAFIWTAENGIDMLQNFVRENTDPDTAALLCDAERSPLLPPCPNWDLWNTAAVSNDGKTIVGTGRNPDGLWEAFKVTIP